MSLFRECTDKHGYLRCCIACKQPWLPVTNTIEDFSTLQCYKIQQKFQEINTTLNSTQLYFAKPVQAAHIIQKAHQFSAFAWACDPRNDLNVANPISITVNQSDWIKNSTQFYTGSWDRPPRFKKIVPKHSKIKKFIFQSRNPNRLNASASLPETLLTCSACNQIMDSRGKFRLFLFGKIVSGGNNNNNYQVGLIPANMVTIQYRTTRNVLPEPRTKEWVQKYMGVLYAWYHYAAFLYMSERVDGAVYAKYRRLSTTLCWLAFCVAVKYYDMLNPSAQNNKPVYCYLGIVTLYISLFFYVCFQAEFPEVNMSFTKFHNFFVLEIPDCCVPEYWDNKRHKYIHSFIFQGINVEMSAKDLITETSNRLMETYWGKIRVLVKQVFLPHPGVFPIQNFFVSFAELDKIYDEMPKDEKTFTTFKLQSFVDNLGIVAILMPHARFLEYMKLGKATNLLHSWIRYVIHEVEYKNIAWNGYVDGYLLHPNQAAIVYRYQYAFNLEAILNENTRNPVTMYRFIKNNDLRSLDQKLSSIPICSIYKALFRLLKYQFNVKDWKGINK